MSLWDINRFEVTAEIVDETETAIRRAGAEGYELFVLWTGTAASDVFTVRTLHIPDQTSYRLDAGLCVEVKGEALHRLNRWLYESSEVLAVQIHSHPTNAFHSSMDSAYPIVTQIGGLSIVLPYFGANGLAGSGVATYRLTSSGWRRLRDRESKRLLKVT